MVLARKSSGGIAFACVLISFASEALQVVGVRASTLRSTHEQSIGSTAMPMSICLSSRRLTAWLSYFHALSEGSARHALMSAYQPQHHVFAIAPGVDVGVVHDRRGSDFGMRKRHALRHHFAHAAQQFLRSYRGKNARRALHVARGDESVATGRRHHREIDVELVRERAPPGWP
jgi:hypothetical protein